MSMSNRGSEGVKRDVLHACAALTMLAAACSASAAPKPPVAAYSGCEALANALPARLSVQVNFHESITLPMPVTRIALAEPTIADVALVGTNGLLVHGRSAGVTSMMVWSSCSSRPIKVQVNVQSLSAQIMKTAGDVEELPSQLQADIRFVELSRSRLRDVGMRFQVTSQGRTGFFSSPNTANVIANAGTPVPLPGLGKVTSPDSFNLLWGGNSQRFMAALNLLEQTGYAYTLSQPSLVAMSGQTATFLAGGEVPVPVPAGSNGTVGIEYKQYGVRLSISPTIVSRDKIILKVTPEVSDLDYSNVVSVGGSEIPSLAVRRTDTTISLADGESFIISGLVSRITSSNVDKLPGLSNIPILGAFFRSNRFGVDDRELVMIVTPRLISPLARTARLPGLPGDAIRDNDPGIYSLLLRGDAQLNTPSSSGLSR